jgi:hypothetical protein
MPDEVLRKVQAIVKVLSHQKRLQAEKQSTYNALMDVLTDLGEHGLVIHALRSSLRKSRANKHAMAQRRLRGSTSAPIMSIGLVQMPRSRWKNTTSGSRFHMGCQRAHHA